MTSRSDIGAWFDEGVADGQTHMLVVTDQFSWEDYPLYYGVQDVDLTLEDLIRRKNGQPMSEVMEVYVLDPKKRESQLNEHRAWHTESFKSGEVEGVSHTSLGTE